jgi:molybdopterin converting factor small subunit
MSVVFHLPEYLATLAGGQNRIRTDGLQSTVGEALQCLLTRYPSLHDRILDEREQVRPHVSIFVGNEPIRSTGELLTQIHDGVSIFVMPGLG